MNYLEGINICLPTCNIPPISSLDEMDDYAAIAKGDIDRLNKESQLPGFSWNTDKHTFTPNSSGEIELPNNTLAIIVPEQLATRLAPRNGKIWDTENETYYGETIEGYIIKLVPFEQVPEAFAIAIAREASVEFSQQFQGNIQYAMMKAEGAWANALNTEYYSVHDSSGFARVAAAYNV